MNGKSNRVVQGKIHKIISVVGGIKSIQIGSLSLVGDVKKEEENLDFSFIETNHSCDSGNSSQKCDNEIVDVTERERMIKEENDPLSTVRQSADVPEEKSPLTADSDNKAQDDLSDSTGKKSKVTQQLVDGFCIRVLPCPTLNSFSAAANACSLCQKRKVENCHFRDPCPMEKLCNICGSTIYSMEKNKRCACCKKLVCMQCLKNQKLDDSIKDFLCLHCISTILAIKSFPKKYKQTKPDLFRNWKVLLSIDKKPSLIVSETGLGFSLEGCLVGKFILQPVFNTALFVF